MQDDVGREPVHSRKTDEVAGDSALPHENERRRPGKLKPRERLPHFAIKSRSGLVPSGRNPEPDGAHTPRVGGYSLDRLCGRTVGGDGDPGENTSEDRSRDSEPETGDERAAIAAADSPPGQPEHVARRAHDGTPRRRRYEAVFTRLPQMDIEHQVDERFRDPS